MGGKLRTLFSREHLTYFIMLNLGLFVTAAGIHFFKSPNHFAMGGTSGISIVASTLFPALNVGDFMLLVNAALILFGLVFLGPRSMGITIYSSLALSLYVQALELLYPMPLPFTQDTFLELCFAVVLPAAGSAIVFNIGSSTGGTDILAMIVSRHTSLEIGKALLVCDFLIAASTLFVYDTRTGLYCILGLLAKAFLVDSVIEGINTRKKITIVSTHSEEILDFIMKRLRRSATVYDARGAYTHQSLQVITTIVGRRQAVELRNFIRKIDSKAFLSIVNSSETIGKGFRNL